MKNVTIERSTVEEAIAAALEELKAEKNEVEVEIIQEASKGFFGLGSKDAKVKVTITNGPEKRASKFLDILLEKMDIEADYEVNYSENILKVDIVKIGEDDKGIIIGKGGAVLKKIGQMARRDIENFFGIKANVKLWVKVKEDWRNRQGLIHTFGLD